MVFRQCFVKFWSLDCHRVYRFYPTFGIEKMRLFLGRTIHIPKTLIQAIGIWGLNNLKLMQFLLLDLSPISTNLNIYMNIEKKILNLLYENLVNILGEMELILIFMFVSLLKDLTRFLFKIMVFCFKMRHCETKLVLQSRETFANSRPAEGQEFANA